MDITGTRSMYSIMQGYYFNIPFIPTDFRSTSTSEGKGEDKTVVLYLKLYLED